MYVSSFIAYLPKMYELFPYYSISPWLKHLLPFEDQIVFSQLLNRGKGEKKMGDNQLPYLPPNHNYRPPPSYAYKVEAPSDIVFVFCCWMYQFSWTYAAEG